MKKKAEESLQTAEPVLTKDQILSSKTFEDKRDALSVALNQNKTYTLEEVWQTLDQFMKGTVK